MSLLYAVYSPSHMHQASITNIYAEMVADPPKVSTPPPPKRSNAQRPPTFWRSKSISNPMGEHDLREVRKKTQKTLDKRVLSTHRYNHI